jgi:hypothetical protein
MAKWIVVRHGKQTTHLAIGNWENEGGLVATCIRRRLLDLFFASPSNLRVHGLDGCGVAFDDLPTIPPDIR